MNFDKLFLQNLLTRGNRSNAPTTFSSESSGSEYDTKRTSGNAEELQEQSRENRCHNESLKEILTRMRSFLEIHDNEKSRKKENNQRDIGEQCYTKCESELSSNSVTDFSHTKHPSYPTNEVSYSPSHSNNYISSSGSVAQKIHHRRKSTSTHQPYSVEAATSSKGLLTTKSFRATERMSKKSEQVVVQVRVVFLKIGEIDTLKEMFRADAFIQTKWIEPMLFGKTDEELGQLDLTKCWNPLIFIENILSESKDQTWMSAKVDCLGNAVLTERRRLRGIFLETLELNDFPLDVQDLTITLSSERPDTEVDLIADTVDLCAINVQTLVDQQEWRLHEHIEINKRSVIQEFSSSSQRHIFLSVTCRAARLPGYFYWNVFLVLFFITGLSFATFSVSAERPENRLQLSFTLFLTSVAFKFVINQSLPKISYLTFMDKYVLMSLGILCIVSVWHAIVTLIPEYAYCDIDNTTQTWLPAILDTRSSNLNLEHRGFFDIMENFNELNSSIFTHKGEQVIISQKFIPGWIRDSLQNVINTHIFDENLSTKETEKMIVQKSIQIFVDRRKEEEKREMLFNQEHLRLLEERRNYLIQLVERYILVIFGALYVLSHVVFVYWLYFGASKRRREMIERDKQYRIWIRKRKIDELAGLYEHT